MGYRGMFCCPDLAADPPRRRRDSSDTAGRCDRSHNRARSATVRGRILIGSGLDLQKPDLSRVVVFLGSDPVLDAAHPRRSTRRSASITRHLRQIS